jgi:hypothetical protein
VQELLLQPHPQPGFGPLGESAVHGGAADAEHHRRQLGPGAVGLHQIHDRRQDRPTGLGAEFNDDYEIDIVAFAAFVAALVRRYCSSNHLILRTLIEGVAAVGIVMVERAGGCVTGLSERSSTIDPNDVAVFATGLGAVADGSRLRSSLTNSNERCHADRLLA